MWMGRGSSERLDTVKQTTCATWPTKSVCITPFSFCMALVVHLPVLFRLLITFWYAEKMTNHAYIPSRILGQDDLSTLTSFNLYDATRDEGDQDNVFSRILHKVRGAVTNNESYQPSHSSSFSSKVYSIHHKAYPNWHGMLYIEFFKWCSWCWWSHGRSRNSNDNSSQWMSWSIGAVHLPKKIISIIIHHHPSTATWHDDGE